MATGYIKVGGWGGIENYIATFLLINYNYIMCNIYIYMCDDSAEPLGSKACRTQRAQGKLFTNNNNPWKRRISQLDWHLAGHSRFKRKNV
jgi:hypothetical protein